MITAAPRHFKISNRYLQFNWSLSTLGISKVIHPKYYKHLKKGAHQSHLGIQKMGWFLADYPVHQVKLKYEIK